MNNEEKEIILRNVSKQLDPFWKEIVISWKEDQYPPRAWMWAYGYLEKTGVQIDANDCIKFFNMHKKLYKLFIKDNNLRFHLHEIALDDSDEDDRTEW